VRTNSRNTGTFKYPKTNSPSPNSTSVSESSPISYWTDEYGQTQYDIAEIIGMLYGASGYKCDEWYYLLRILESETSPKLVGSNDRAFHKESSLGADDTDIEQG
jgi:hypothetical protein